MKLKTLVLLGLFCILSCNESRLENKRVNHSNPITISPNKEVFEKSIAIADKPLKCTCVENSYKRIRDHEVSFQNIKSQAKENLDKFSKWSDDSLRFKVKSIRFSHFDSIPEKFRVFKNIEQVIIADVRNGNSDSLAFYGLDLFPKLKSLVFWGSSISINPQEKWLTKIERIYAEKSIIYGIKDFTALPNLRTLSFAYSGFHEFPENIESLKCLSELTLGAYRGGELELSTMDLRHLPCLKTLQLQTWYNTLIGLPLGLDSLELDKLTIHHQGLTFEEKEKLKLY